MPTYRFLTPGGELGRPQEFAGAPPALAPHKGLWLLDNPPAYNPRIHRLRVGSAGPAGYVPYTVEPLPLEAVLAARLAELAARRYTEEVAGVAFGAHTFATDRAAQAALAGAYAALKDGLVSSVEWKAEDGWVTLDFAAAGLVAARVSAHVQGCFACERAHADALAALATAEAVQNYDITQGWPL